MSNRSSTFIMNNHENTTTFKSWVYLSREEILAGRIYHCSIHNCSATFHNAANMQMHIARHHKTVAPKIHSMYKGSDTNEENHFFCPSVDCCYYQTPSDIGNGARHFASFRSLKQHYLKVHGERTFGCTTCGKSFAAASFLRHHHLSCGRTFKCEHCSFSYGSREALLTHAKRKGHGYEKLLSCRKPTVYPLSEDQVKLKGINTGTQTAAIRKVDRMTQTEQSPTCRDSSNGTDLHSSVAQVTIDQYRTHIATSINAMIDSQPQSNTIDNAESAVVCTETQTDFMDVMFPNVENQHDPLLSYSHMYTQTSDDPGLIADLGLSTIETQTSWNEGAEAFGDYLVSTETQTNFDIDSFSCSSHCNDKIDQAQTNAIALSAP